MVQLLKSALVARKQLQTDINKWAYQWSGKILVTKIKQKFVVGKLYLNKVTKNKKISRPDLG